VRTIASLVVAAMLAAATGARADEPPAAPIRKPSDGIPYLVGLLALGLGGASLTFALASSSTTDKARAETDPVKQAALYDSADTKKQLVVGTAIAGAALGGVAVWLYLRGRDRPDAAPPSPPPPAAGLSLAPVLGGGRTGVEVRGAF